MLKQALKKLMDRKTLTEAESYQVMEEILSGKATAAQISSFISILTYRGVEVEELTGLARAMRERALPVRLEIDRPVVDTCGTGGDGAKTFNISTASAIVVASAGVPVAKHGNRAASSLSGSADVLEVLGLPVEMTPAAITKALEQFNMCFMFAPIYHQAMKYAAGPRKEIGFRSVFNLLGPLTNPAGIKHQVIGLFDDSYSEKVARTLHQLGARHVLIVAGEDGLDELSVSAPTRVTELKDGQLSRYRVTPEAFGLGRHPLSAIQVESAEESAEFILNVLSGQDKGAAYDIVCFNAGAALYVGQKVPTLAEGIQLAKGLIDSGQAYQHYQDMIKNKEAIRYA
ncbi:Anthranilate phosphoribosyltransferase [Caldalkalibacillus thermarum TA2.A1]|uniref:Anthranilate phosphoribosyltransferase n=1 Tax=Caldalkalibacillus thermarum (strain TA2.A1) TaxID=986075 RepID=F5L729_CALTT|nr:anthranilate phosphoribosyltransferase [Caldalkalibacillus thermarum]EGL82864.1 Anthranilate phosphoribosyltransferase [Caldalkalibacillus thermarum TA2.A1]QZT35390.1 anthranilate phosphoribosyltransferase [Caldalkalibacillus thermarum TA2.A1]GGK24859.1 anthranilate phosphoribosyltransferase [Caldalkalibacillus thermarum]